MDILLLEEEGFCLSCFFVSAEPVDANQCFMHARQALHPWTISLALLSYLNDCCKNYIPLLWSYCWNQPPKTFRKQMPSIPTNDCCWLPLQCGLILCCSCCLILSSTFTPPFPTGKVILWGKTFCNPVRTHFVASLLLSFVSETFKHLIMGLEKAFALSPLGNFFSETSHL